MSTYNKDIIIIITDKCHKSDDKVTNLIVFEVTCWMRNLCKLPCKKLKRKYNANKRLVRLHKL